MLTRCPHCQTQFRVRAEQLTIRQGRVRCGVCQQAFNALESLRDEIVAAPTEIPAFTRVDPHHWAAHEISAPPGEESASPTPAVSTMQVASPAEADEASAPVSAAPEEVQKPEPASAPGRRLEEAEAAPEPEMRLEEQATAEPTMGFQQTEEAQTTPDDAAAASDALPRTPSVPAAPASPRRWPWAAGSVALALLLVAQLVYIFRSELAVSAPASRPFLISACETLGCSVPRPLRPDLMGIETSDLAPDGDKLRLSATLKNHASYAQDYPYLEITLTDTQDAALVKKALAPADYLPAGLDVAAGFPPGGEINVNLLLTVADVSPVGYRLYLFYP
jgi:predicted Zn finger-like uncharacterized protein